MSESTDRFEGKSGGDILVEDSCFGEGSIYVRVTSQHGTSAHNHFAKEQAPALALAVLEAAGYEPGSAWLTQSAEGAVVALRVHVREQAAAAQEAADREALEREAEELFEAFREVDLCNLNHWGGLADVYKKPWLAAARAARKLHQKEEGK